MIEATTPARGPIIETDNVETIYAEDVWPSHVFEHNVMLTLAVFRPELGKGEDGKGARKVIAHLVLPFSAANEMAKALHAASATVTDQSTPTTVSH